jgi:hypothetical protein
MLGREDLDKLAAQKQALLVESSLNRLALQAEAQNFRSATAWLRAAGDGAGKFRPLLFVLAPVAGFLLARVARRRASWLSQGLAAARWLGPLYGLWKRFGPGQRKAEAEAEEPAP